MRWIYCIRNFPLDRFLVHREKGAVVQTVKKTNKQTNTHIHKQANTTRIYVLYGQKVKDGYSSRNKGSGQDGTCYQNTAAKQMG